MPLFFIVEIKAQAIQFYIQLIASMFDAVGRTLIWSRNA